MTGVFDVTDLVADIAAANAAAYHERLNKALNRSLARAERRYAEANASPSRTTMRLNRQAVHACEALLDLAAQCAGHFEFHP